MRTISQREMRNESGQVLREVEAGAVFTITSRGRPVARLVPVDQGVSGRRPARRPPVFSADELVRVGVASSDVLDELRSER